MERLPDWSVFAIAGVLFLATLANVLKSVDKDRNKTHSDEHIEVDFQKRYPLKYVKIPLMWILKTNKRRRDR